MRWMKWMCVATLLIAFAQQAVFAKEGARPWQLNNRLRLEYDDNIYQTENDTKSSFKVIEEVEFILNFNLQNTFVGVKYRPQFVWWENRESDKTDFNNDVDFIFNHAFTPRLTLSLTDTLRRGELPELVNGNIVVRENDDFYYNTANATLGYLFQPQTRLDLAGRYILMRYDDSTTSENENYDIWTGGLTLRQRVVPASTVLGDLRYEQVKYDGVDRGSKNIYAGLGLEQTFSPNLIGSVRGGYQNKKFNDDDLGSQSSPYGDVSLTLLPSPATRLTGGASYSLSEANIFPYADQEMLQAYLSFAYDITARVALYLSGGYTRGEYKGEYAVEGTQVAEIMDVPVKDFDGTENIYQVSARATYKLNRSNWLEVGYQFVNFDTDMREPYKRNRFDVGWKLKI